MLSAHSGAVHSIDGLEGRVKFDHVSFGYTPDKQIIKDFNALVQPGQKVAIVEPHRCRKNHNG